MALFILVATGFALVLTWRLLAALLISKGAKNSTAHMIGAASGIAIGALVFQVLIMLGRSEVHHNAWEGDIASIQKYLDDGGDIEAVHPDGPTILAYAAGGGSIELVNFLIAKGARVNASGRDGITPLHLAAREGHPNIVALLLSNGADPNNFAESYNRSSTEKDSDFPYECTPLHWVTSREKLETEKKLQVIDILLSHGADPNAFNARCSVPVFEAVRVGDLSAAKLLLERGSWTNPVKQVVSTDQAIALLRNPNTPPFHLAVLSSNYAMVQLFLEHGANPNVKVKGRNGESYSPLKLAKQENIKSLLKKYGASE